MKKTTKDKEIEKLKKQVEKLKSQKESLNPTFTFYSRFSC